MTQEKYPDRLARKREAPRLKGLCAGNGEVRLPSNRVKRLAGSARYRTARAKNRSGTAFVRLPREEYPLGGFFIPETPHSFPENHQKEIKIMKLYNTLTSKKD